MDITDKSTHDPVADLHLVDAYLRWALLAAEDVAGKNGVAAVLRDSGLDHFIDNYPDEFLEPRSGITYGDYASFNAALLNFFGRAAKSMTMRIGRVSARHGIEKQGALFGLATLVAAKLLPLPNQIKKGVEAQINGFRKLHEAIGETYRARLEDRGDKFAYVVETCGICAGKQSDDVMCYTFTGLLQESTNWLTGKNLDIVEIKCRATGDPACEWEISKTSKT